MDVTAQTEKPRAPWLPVALDVFERLFVIGLFIRLCFTVFGSVTNGANPVNYLVLASEGLVVALVMLRRPASELSMRPLDWFLALTATGAPLLVRPGHVAPLVPPGVAGGLILTGIAFQIASKLTLRWSFGVAPANRGLIIAGPYRLVRHPIYASYLISQAGFLLMNPTVWNLSVLGIGLIVQLFRIGAEERVLAHDAAHAAFRKAVPYRLVPGIY